MILDGEQERNGLALFCDNDRLTLFYVAEIFAQLVFYCLIPTVIIRFFEIENRHDYAESWLEFPGRGSGISSHVLPSSSRPVVFFLVPPHCLKKNGTP